MYSRERDMKKEVAFMKVIQISDFHLRGDGKLSFQKADTMKAFASDDRLFLFNEGL